MPYSNPSFDKTIEKFLIKHKFEHYLDIGPGAGKYGKIIRKNFPNAKITGVEAEQSYIKQFELKDLYDNVYPTQIEMFIEDKPDFTTDVVIIGDCLEHLKKSDGIDLLHYLIYRVHYIIVIFPTKVIQYSWQGHKREAHLSVWSKHDFAQFDSKFFKKKFMNLAIVKGYLEDSTSVYVQS